MEMPRPESRQSVSLLMGSTGAVHGCSIQQRGKGLGLPGHKGQTSQPVNERHNSNCLVKFRN